MSYGLHGNSTSNTFRMAVTDCNKIPNKDILKAFTQASFSSETTNSCHPFFWHSEDTAQCGTILASQSLHALSSTWPLTALSNENVPYDDLDKAEPPSNSWQMGFVALSCKWKTTATDTLWQCAFIQFFFNCKLGLIACQWTQRSRTYTSRSGM